MRRPGDLVRPRLVQGRVLGHYVPDGTPPQLVPLLSRPANSWQHNDLAYSWSLLMQRLLRGAANNIGINGMYFEFDNSGSDVDPVPTVSRSEGLEYYAGLADPQDYLRVPISATAESTTDADLFAANVATFWAQTAGAVGVHGLPFTSGDGSRVYGGALVSMPDPEDESQDILYSRFYWAPGSQLEKLPNLQCSIRWPVAFL